MLLDQSSQDRNPVCGQVEVPLNRADGVDQEPFLIARYAGTPEHGWMESHQTGPSGFQWRSLTTLQNGRVEHSEIRRQQSGDLLIAQYVSDLAQPEDCSQSFWIFRQEG